MNELADYTRSLQEYLKKDPRAEMLLLSLARKVPDQLSNGDYGSLSDEDMLKMLNRLCKHWNKKHPHSRDSEPIGNQEIGTGFWTFFLTTISKIRSASVVAFNADVNTEQLEETLEAG